MKIYLINDFKQLRIQIFSLFSQSLNQIFGKKLSIVEFNLLLTIILLNLRFDSSFVNPNYSRYTIFDFDYWSSTLSWKRRNWIQYLLLRFPYFKNWFALLESPLMSWFGVGNRLKLLIGIPVYCKLLPFIFKISIKF